MNVDDICLLILTGAISLYILGSLFAAIYCTIKGK